MATLLPKQSLNEHIDTLCSEYPEFKAFNSKFRGKYDIISIDKSYGDLAMRVLGLTISVEFTSGRMKGMSADLKIKKIQKQ